MKTVVFVLAGAYALFLPTADSFLHECPPDHHDILALVIFIYLNLTVVFVLHALDEFYILLSETSCAVAHALDCVFLLLG